MKLPPYWIFLLLISVSLSVCMQPVRQVKPISVEGKGGGVQGVSLSYGMIKKHLSVGHTTQENVLRLFGSPNNMTTSSSGTEIWVYDKVRTELSSNSERNTVGGGLGSGTGMGSGVIGTVIGGSNSSSSSNLVSSTNTLTVIMEFNKDNVLIDYSARQGRY